MPGIWTSLTFHHRSISWPIDRVFRIPLVISWRPELTALLTALPRAAMLVLLVGIAQAEALMLHLAPPTPSKRKKRCITTNPLLTTRRFDQRREVLGHGKALESRGQSRGEPHVERLPRPKNRSNHTAIVNVSRACENQYGPHLAPQQTPCVMENVGPPDMREAALT